MRNEIFKIRPDSPLCKDLVTLSFDITFTSLPKEPCVDDSFIFPNELFTVNVGETEKFTSDYIYQSKFVVFKAKDKLNFGGYCPDYNRTCDLLRDKNGNTAFEPGTKYHVVIKLTKYRVYIDVNDGFATDFYGNGRDAIDEVRFYANKDVRVKLENVTLKEEDRQYPIKDRTLKRFLDEGLFCNYLSYHTDGYGLYFDRLNIIQNIKCTTRNSGQYETGVMLDFYSDTGKLKISYTVMDAEIRDYDLKFGLFVNRKALDGKTRKVNKGDHITDEFALPPGDKRITLVFPCCHTVAIDKISIDKNAAVCKVKKKKTIVLLGDSITEGSECLKPEHAYFNKLALKYDLYSVNMAVSGRSFNDYNLLGDYSIKPDYVLIANGTNSFCMGTAQKDAAFGELEKTMETVIKAAKSYFPKALIIGLLPIWRSDENGPNFTLRETAEKMKEIYQRYKDIKIIDCYRYIPFDAKYFSGSNLALHPNYQGHAIYGDKLIEDISHILGRPKKNYDKYYAAKMLDGKKKAGEKTK